MPRISLALAKGFYTKDWQGFQDVWLSARKLNQIVVHLAARARLPVISFPPSAATSPPTYCATMGADTNAQRAETWVLSPWFTGMWLWIRACGTILSTEDLFVHLAKQLKPARIFLAGSEEGVLLISSEHSSKSYDLPR
jgi:isopentenyl phosphate kinase